MSTWISRSLFFLLLATPLAQAQTRAVVCDSTLDAVIVFEDSDGDGGIDPLTEVVIFYDDSSPGPDLSTPNHLLPHEDGYLLSDGGSHDSIFYLQDGNGDGDANDDGEITVFYDDDAEGPSLSTSNAMSRAPDGAIYVSDDGAAVRAVLRLVDLNGDGDAQDAGEGAVFYDTTALSPDPVVSDPESIAVLADGSVVVGDTETGRIVRLLDLDGDGAALSLGEATVYYSGANGPSLTDLDTLIADNSGVLFAVNEDDGLILRLVDANGDGDADDVGENSIWLDPSATPASDPNDAALVMGATGPVLYVADGASDAVWRLEDTDRSGSIDRPEEATEFFADGGALLSTPSGIVVSAPTAPPEPPQVTEVAPSRGSILGGEEITISGANLETVTELEFVGSGTAAMGVAFTLEADGSLSCVAPAQTGPGSVDLVLVGTGGTTTAVAAYEYAVPFVRGDADGSGSVEITDVVRILEYLYAGTLVDCLDSLDCDDDQAIEISDAVWLLAYLFQSGPAPAEPFGEAAIDPTPGTPGCDALP